jgi:CMP-N-acetylneuraminic acid synthetase
VRTNEGRRVLGTICARGGSKGVPKKNIRPLCGKPLIAYTIETALQCKALDRVIVSTDDPEIRDVALSYGAEAPFLRPSELATDKASKWPVLRHVVSTLEQMEGYTCDIVLDMDPTSPLREAADIDACLRMLLEEKADTIITVCEAPKNPYFNMVEDQDGGVQLCKVPERPITCRQDAPRVYAMNASIYAMWRAFLMEKDGVFAGRTKAYVMPPERSVDIDRELDFEFVEFLMRRRVRA